MTTKLLTISALALTLGGCAGMQVSPAVDKWHVVEVPADFYQCPMPKFPRGKDLSTLTDVDVAKILVNMKTDNQICRASLNKIKTYLENSRRKFNMNS